MKISGKLSSLAFCWLTVAPFSVVADSAEDIAGAGESPEFSAGWIPPINAFELYSQDFRMLRATDFKLPTSDPGSDNWPDPEAFEMSQQEFDMSHLPAPRLQGIARADGFFHLLKSFVERPVGQTQSSVVYVGVTNQGYAGIYLKKREPTLAADAFVRSPGPVADSEL